MLQRVRQQQQQQQQQHHHQAQPSYSLLHSSPLNPTAYGSTPTKAATPSSIHTSSHHKQAPSPSCYSPSGAAITRTSAATTTAASRQNSPVHQARSWGTLIWSAEYALKFLRKVLASLPQAANGAGDSSKAGRLGGDGRTDASGRSHRHHHRHHQSHGARPAGGQHVHHLRGRFVKIESRSAPGNHRPVYQEFKRWPALLLTDRELAGRKAPFADVHEAPERKQQPVDEQRRKGNVTHEPDGGGGTPVEGTSTSRMTRKLASAANNSVATRTTTTATGKSGETVVKKRAQDKAAAPPRDCGYCEICRIEYDSLAAHVQSDSHQTFVQNDDNFLSLDRLLDSLGGVGDSDETKLAEEDGYDGGEGGGPGGAVAVETFFQQLHCTTRIKRGPGEELLYERRKPPASSAAPQPKAIVGAGGGGTGGDKRQEEKEEEEDGAEGRRNKATTVTVAVTTTTTAAADELIERQQQNTTAPIGEEGEQEARSTQVEATAKQALEEEKPAKIATSKEGDDVNSEETKGKPRAKVKRKRTTTTSTSTGADCEEEKCEGKDKYGDKDKKALIRLAIQSVIATFDCSDGFLAEVDQTLDDSVRLDDSVVVGKKEEKESVKEQADKSPAIGESGVSDKRAANSSSSRVSVTNRDSSGKKKEEEEVLVGQRTSRVRSCKQQQTEAETAELSVRRSERKPPGSAFREVREEKEKEKVLSKPAEEPEAASGEGMFGRRSAIHHHPHNQLNHHNHQKHKSTLSALLLKQQQERAQQQQQQQEKEKQQQWDERKATDSAAVLDHAAGMKVITDFRTKQQQQQQEAVEDDGELVAHKSVLLVGVPATEAIAPAATEDARPEETGTPKTGAGRRKRNPQRAEEDATSMGLKASTTASMNKHHHHHHHHLSESGSGGGAGTKTRHATELAATLLECDGLDPKNTKRISLGLRQNPKRANLNEDFTSLLDETLERSKMSGSSTSVRRTAQSRIRVGPKAKEQHTVVTPKQQQVEEEPSNRVCEDEAKETHDRLKPAAAAAGSNKRSSGSAKKTVTLEDIKVRGIRWRAPSPMTRPPVKSPLLYKVIDNQAGGEETVSSSGGISTSRPTATTTTATGLQASQRKDSTATGGSAQLPSSAQSRTTCKASKVNGASPGKKNGLIVKIRRVRQSELSLLNDEAENFMFPRKDDSSSDEETDDGRQTSSEGYQGGSANNYSVDITSSSEADRGMATEDATANEVVMENHSEEDEDEEPAATREEEKRTVTGGGRKRKKAIPASGQRACSIESSDHRSSPVSSRSSPTLPIASKRARLETAARRKAQQTADFGKGQDPVDARVRFPEAPIQPCPVAEAAKTSPSSTDRARRRRRSQSSASEDGQQHDDDEDDDANNDDAAQVEEKDEGEEEEHEEEEEVKQVVVKSRRGRGAGMRGRRGQRKAYREDSVTSTSSTTAAIGPCPTCSIAKGRGRGRRGGVAGRRGRRGAGRAARGSRLQAGGSASCNCHLLDASRMPPPSSRRRTNESVERAATPASPRKAGTRASKTKTTPPGAVSSSSFTSSYGGDGAAMMAGASHSSYIKGKEDGMGAVFKWINFRKRCEEIEPYRFAFERVPSLEPWYETFQRQDDGTEKVYEYFGSTGYRKLPYEMGPLPALGQNCCILNYKVVPASRKSNRTTSLQSCSSASLEPSSPGGRKSSRPSSSDVQQSFGGAASTADEPTESKKCSPSSSLSSLPLKKRKLLLQEGGGGTDGSGSSKTDAGGGSGSSAATAGGEASSNSSRIARLIAGANERPRKSPREHASTLAILSLLQQQQHRKRAGTIKILTSPRKATTATATQTTALHEQLLHQDADSNGEEPSRSCSRASDRASSRAGSSTGGIKFDRPLFPDSSYVNSRTLCQELDAFLSDELKRVTGSKDGGTTLGAIVKQERSDTGEAEETDERIAIDETADKSETLLEQDDLMMDQELLLPPSVVQEGVAIERNELPVSKRDLLDVLQTVGTEPPLSLKLVQRCESVVKKIVQYDRKERPMVASGTGSGLAISSGSPVIGLQLFDSGSPLAACGPGSGPGSVGGTFLKKRINRTGWPTNKRKIGTRTRQQSRFMLPSSLAGGKKSLSRESIKKEPEEQRGVEKEEEEEEDGSLSQQQPQQCAIKAEESLQRHAETEEEEEEEDNEEQDEGEDNDDEADEEEDEEEDEHEDEDDDAETVVEEKIRPARGGGASRKDVAQANHKKTDCVRRKQREDDSKEEARANHTPAGRRGRKRSVGGKRGVAKRDQINAAAISDDEHDDDDDEQAKEALAASTCDKRPTEKDRSTTVPGPTVDTMPTLRAALMRDNSQLQRLLSSPSSKPPAFSSASPSSILAPGSLNRGTVPFTTTPGRGAAATAGGENVPCPPTPSAPTSGPVLGVNSCKYVTKTTTTMTRVDYDGGGGGGPFPPKRKHSREDVAANNEQEEHHLPKEDARQKQQTGGVTNRHRSSVALATHDSDDKECDSISSRSIFVSDDCDTTSSSTAINPPDERPPSTSELPSGSNDPAAVPSAPSQTNPRLPAIRVRRKESSDNEETIHSAAATEEEEEEEEHSVNVPLATTTTNKATKSPRTPSERIRNKMVKNRRAAVRADQTAKGRAGSGGKRPPAKKHHDVQIRAASSSKRRKSSSLGPPLPPPSMMPLSPPLTTSTSSSSSSSYGADDKAPLSPAPAKAHDCESIEEEEEQQHTTTAEQYSSRAKAGEGGEGGVVLTPSKIKTRSSTFGYSPPKRTYGTGKQTPKKLPFVSLIKTNFVQSAAEATAAAEVTLVNGKKAVDGSSTGKGNRRRKAEEKKPRKPSTSPAGRKPSAAGGRKKKDSETVADDAAVAGSDVGGTTDGKRSKKLTLKAKQLLARKRLPKAAKRKEAATSGHFNNNSDGHSNDDGGKEEEDPLLCTLTITTEEQQQQQQQEEECLQEVQQKQHHLPEQQFHHQRQRRESSRVHDLLEEHLIEEEEEDAADHHHELMEVDEEEEEEAQEEDDEVATELEEVDEEEHYELLEVEEVEEEEDGDDGVDGGAEHLHRDVEDTFPAGEAQRHHHHHHNHHHHRQQARREDEKRKLVMADHDYSDQHDDTDPPIVDAEFVEVEELEEEDHLDDDGEEEEAEDEHEEEEEEEDDDDDDDDDGESTITTLTAPPAVGFGKQQQQHQPRVKLTFTSSGGTSTVVMTSSGMGTAASTSTSTTTKSTFNSSSPNKYSPRKLRKPRGRWYRER